jgi:hypothetical protein
VAPKGLSKVRPRRRKVSPKNYFQRRRPISSSTENPEFEDSISFFESVKCAWEGDQGFLKHLEELESSYLILQRSSEPFFGDQHPAGPSTRWSDNFRVVLDSERPYRGQATGIPSEELYIAWVSLTDGTGEGLVQEDQPEDQPVCSGTGAPACSCNVKLELDLSARNDELDPSDTNLDLSTLALLRFQLVLKVPGEEEPLDLLIEGPFNWISQTRKRQSSNFKDSIPLIPNTYDVCAIKTTEHYFRGSGSSHQLKVEGSKSIVLRDLFQRPNSRPDEQPSAGFLEERSSQSSTESR